MSLDPLRVAGPADPCKRDSCVLGELDTLPDGQKTQNLLSAESLFVLGELGHGLDPERYKLL